MTDKLILPQTPGLGVNGLLGDVRIPTSRLQRSEFEQKRAMFLADVKRLRKMTKSFKLDFNLTHILDNWKEKANTTSELIDLFELRMEFHKTIKDIKNAYPTFKFDFSFLIPSRYLEASDWREEFYSDQNEETNMMTQEEK